jgi:hypothetical protein
MRSRSATAAPTLTPGPGSTSSSPRTASVASRSTSARPRISARCAGDASEAKRTSTRVTDCEPGAVGPPGSAARTPAGAHSASANVAAIHVRKRAIVARVMARGSPYESAQRWTAPMLR